MNRGILDGGDGVANHKWFIPGDPPEVNDCRIPRREAVTATAAARWRQFHSQ
jgi:hypothetical protein